MSPKTASNIAPVWYVVLAVLLWSTGGLFIKLTSLDAYQVTFFRSLLAGLTVLLVTRKHGLKIDLFGIICSIIYATLLFLFVWATKHTTAANAIFLQYTADIHPHFGPFCDRREISHARPGDGHFLYRRDVALFCRETRIK